MILHARRSRASVIAVGGLLTPLLVHNFAPPLAIASSAGFAAPTLCRSRMARPDGEVYDYSPVVPNGDFDSFCLWRRTYYVGMAEWWGAPVA